MDNRDRQDRRTRRARGALVTVGTLGALGTAAAIGLTTQTAGASDNSPTVDPSQPSDGVSRPDRTNHHQPRRQPPLAAPGQGSPHGSSGGS